MLRVIARTMLAASLSLGLLCVAHKAEAGGGNPWGAEVGKPEAATPQPESAPWQPSAGHTPPGTAGSRRSSPRVVSGPVSFSGTTAATMVRIELSAGVEADVFTLASPFRVIIELPETAFKTATKPGTRGEGLVEAYGSGAFAAGRFRIVLQTVGPVQATPFPVAAAGSGHVLEIALTPMAVTAFGEGTGARRQTSDAKPSDAKPVDANPPDTASGMAKTTPAAHPPAGLPDFSGLSGAAPPVPSKPVIIIDAGHGGIDPGAVGAGNLLEKDIVMAVAAKLQEALSETGRYRVQMTRQEDAFISLEQRVTFSRKNAANLFISIHADSIEQSTMAQSISGATVYTLSDRASDEASRKMAEKENASDLLAGITNSDKDDDEVNDILIDLMRRETAIFSAEFSKVLLGKLKNGIQLSREPHRSAAFKVLKQAHAPSVLLELGYMTNADEAKRLNSPQWQQKVADRIAAAVDAYFASRTAKSE